MPAILKKKNLMLFLESQNKTESNLSKILILDKLRSTKINNIQKTEKNLRKTMTKK